MFNILPFQLILDFMKLYPDIRVEWCEYPNEDVKEMIRASRLDYGFVVGDGEGEEMNSRKLAGCEVLLLVYEGHLFYEKTQVTVEMLEAENVILMNEHYRMYHDFVGACQVRGFAPRIIAKTADGTVLYKLCSQKIGLALIPGFLLNEFKMEAVHAVPFEEHMHWNVYGVCKKAIEKHTAVKIFEQFLHDKIDE